MAKKAAGTKKSCSFCGRNYDAVSRLIQGDADTYICNECVDACHLLLKKDQKHIPSKPIGKIPTPPQIKEHLDEYIIGQEKAKKTLAVAVYNHYKRLITRTSSEGVEIEKSNILLIGPTGTGKTLLARTLARVLDVPFAIADATTITESGYVGDDVETVLVHLLQNCDYDVERAERGIIYIDEIDKISRRSDSQSITRDVSGEGVQQALLKILEGTVAGIPPRGGRKHPEQSLIYVNTKNILFICGGAFEGIEKTVARRMSNKSIGFMADASMTVEETAELIRHTEPQDLLRFGFIPELIGRLPVIAPLSPLSDDAMRDILINPKNALLKQYQKLFIMEGVELSFSESALAEIVDRAKKRKTGARGLRAIMEEIMLPIMFSLPDKRNIRKCAISTDASGEISPVYELAGGEQAALHKKAE